MESAKGFVPDSAAIPVRKQRSSTRWIRWLTIASFFLVWQFGAMANQHWRFFNPEFLPPPTESIRTGYEMLVAGELPRHMVASFLRLVVGFSLGTSAAVVVGILTTRSKLVESVIEPLVNLVGPIPPFAFLPLFIIWFGVGEKSKITLITYTTFLPMLAYTVDGLKSVNPVLIRSALSLGASEAQVFRRVILMSALPNIFVGMRVSAALAFGGLVIAEMIGASAGLGYIIIDARNYFRIDRMFLAAALIGIEYTIFTAFLSQLEARVLSWRKGGLEHAIEKRR